jgi:anaerobic nitric oxide reductase flavorubredoxin
MERKIDELVSWVGVIDWDLKSFHGEEYSTWSGTTYNSYLVRGAEKTVLIDTVWDPFADQFVENLEQAVSLDSLDAVIANHGEVDHSGALPALLEKRPDLPVYCTANGVKSLKGQYHKEWNFQVVKTGDKLAIGDGKELLFVEIPMLHWPDSMMTYLVGGDILFSNDAFGQHYATHSLFNDDAEEDQLLSEAIKYYANILTPFSAQVTKKIHELLSLNLPISIIAPSHGVIWRKNPTWIVEQYLKWADDYQENQILIAYDTMWNGTRKSAELVAEGIRELDPSVRVKLMNSGKVDKNDIITEVFRSKAVIVGSPTINKGILHSVAGLLETAAGLRFKKKKAAAMGCYGWSGEGPELIAKRLEEGGFDLFNSQLNILWNPDQDSAEGARDFGRKFVEFVG